MRKVSIAGIHSQFAKLLTACIIFFAAGSAHAQEPHVMPEGARGWSYYISIFPLQMGHARSPEQACKLSAQNHFGVKLLGMAPSELPKPIRHCFYKNPFGGKVFDYSLTYFECKPGYIAKSPGVCVDWPEAPRPRSCSPTEPGYAVGNPVAVSSGAKIQAETDFPGWATGSTRYRYETVEFEENSHISGTERLIAVDVYDNAERLLTTKRYHYDDINSRHLLTGVTNNKGVRFSTYAYDQSGRAILSEHAGGANRYTFAYPAEDKRVVTAPLGSQREIHLEYNDSMGRITRASQPAGSGRGPGLSTITYDRLGRPSSSTDFNGNKTCFFTDAARGLVTSQISGLGPTAACPASETAAIAPGNRRSITQWHPDLELEIATARAQLITRYVYNGQPDANGTQASCAENATQLSTNG